MFIRPFNGRMAEQRAARRPDRLHGVGKRVRRRRLADRRSGVFRVETLQAEGPGGDSGSPRLAGMSMTMRVPLWDTSWSIRAPSLLVIIRMIR